MAKTDDVYPEVSAKFLRNDVFDASANAWEAVQMPLREALEAWARGEMEAVAQFEDESARRHD